MYFQTISTIIKVHELNSWHPDLRLQNTVHDNALVYRIMAIELKMGFVCAIRMAIT